jgi:predicted transposase YbfD/YdcC
MSQSFFARLDELVDPRDRRGCRYPLTALVGLCLVAMLAGHTTYAAIAQFGRLRGTRLGHALGFKNGQMPCANTLSLLFRQLDADHLDRLVGAWLTERHAGGWEHVAFDGKTLRGSRDGEVPAMHLLAAYAPQAAAVLGQMTVEATTNEHKAALRLLDVLPPLEGTVVTADAMFTHADFAVKVRQQGGHYILYAKENQPHLRHDLQTTFDAATSGDFSPDAATAMGGGLSHRPNL